MCNDPMLPRPPQRPAPDEREIEWQLATDDLAPVRRWLEAHRTVNGLQIAPLPAQRLQDTYLDTPDWRVFRSGFALRVRQGAGPSEATLKSLRSARADLADRQEVTETLTGAVTDPAGAPGSVGAWLRLVLGDRPLRVLFVVHTRRERFAVHGSGRPTPIGEIALDETVVRAPSEVPLERLLRVEVEVRGGNPQALASLVEALQRSCRLRPARENKFAAGVRAAALAPPLD